MVNEKEDEEVDRVADRVEELIDNLSKDVDELNKKVEWLRTTAKKRANYPNEYIDSVVLNIKQSIKDLLG